MLMLLTTVLLSYPAYSDEFRLLDLDSFDMRAAKFGCNRDPLTPDIGCHQYLGRVATDFNLRIMEVGYWNNEVHGEGTESQFQTMGWHWELGLRLTNQISIYHEHHSRHRLDSTGPDYNQDERSDGFPVEDSYGIRMQFYISNKPHRGLLQ